MDSYLASVAKDLILSVLANGEHCVVCVHDWKDSECVNETHACVFWQGAFSRSLPALPGHGFFGDVHVLEIREFAQTAHAQIGDVPSHCLLPKSELISIKKKRCTCLCREVSSKIRWACACSCSARSASSSWDRLARALSSPSTPLTVESRLARSDDNRRASSARAFLSFSSYKTHFSLSLDEKCLHGSCSSWAIACLFQVSVQRVLFLVFSRQAEQSLAGGL